MGYYYFFRSDLYWLSHSLLYEFPMPFTDKHAGSLCKQPYLYSCPPCLVMRPSFRQTPAFPMPKTTLSSRSHIQTSCDGGFCSPTFLAPHVSITCVWESIPPQSIQCSLLCVQKRSLPRALCNLSSGDRCLIFCLMIGYIGI